jgi:amino acid transporter
MSTTRSAESREQGVNRPGRLKGNAVGALGAAVMSMAFMGPATSIAFNTAPGAAKIGYALPVGILLALLACLILASTIGAFSSKLPSAGFAYTFNTNAFGKGAGFLSGWLLAFAYASIGPILFTAMGAFGSQFLNDQFHWNVPWWIISALMIAVIWFIGSRGVSRSTKTALIFLVLELSVILALIGTVIGKGGASGNTLSPFNPAHSLTGVSGIGFGMLWGILMFVGFESAGTLGEETRNPRRSVPIALFGAVIMVGLVYVLSGYAAAIGFGAQHANDLAADGSPWTTLTDTFWGKNLGWLFVLTVLNSQFANALSGSNAAVRIIFALGREGIIHRRLGTTDRADNPMAAWIAYIAMSAVITFGLGLSMGPLNAYAFLGSFLGLGIIVIYIWMNIGLTRYFWVKHRDEFSLVRHGILPTIGSLLMLLPIYGQLVPVPDWPYRLVPYLLVAWVIIGVGYFLVLRRRDPQVIDAMGAVWEPDVSTSRSSDPHGVLGSGARQPGGAAVADAD